MSDSLKQNYKLSYKTQRHITSLFVLNAGSQKCEGGYGWGPGIRDHFLIHHVAFGTGTYVAAGKTYRVSAGQTFIAYPGETISYCADEHDPWEYIWVGFGGSDARFLLEQTDFSPDNPVMITDHGGKLKPLMQAVYRSHGNQPHDSVRMTGSLYMLLSYLMEYAKKQSDRGDDAMLAYVRRAAEYVSDNYARPITVDDMARFAGVSRSWLYRSFKQHLSVSPISYLNSFRIEQARILLSNSALSVGEVSCSVGFDDPFYFSKVFKSLTGESPRAYIKAHRKTDF